MIGKIEKRKARCMLGAVVHVCVWRGGGGGGCPLVSTESYFWKLVLGSEMSWARGKDYLFKITDM